MDILFGLFVGALYFLATIAIVSSMDSFRNPGEWRHTSDELLVFGIIIFLLAGAVSRLSL